jgi:Domain of unknown function (DUF4349)
MRKLAAIISLTFALGLLAGCSSGDEDSASAGGGVTASEPAALDASKDVVEGAAGELGTTGDVALGDPVPEVGPQVVQTASVRLSVRRGRFGEVVDEARSIAGGFGGFVVSSTASQGTEQRLVRGTLVLRIPARSYADAMKSLAALGRVESRNESGQDVSQEYVDLRARVRQLQAVEAQLLELLDRADTVGAALAVQQQLSQVQLELEQARGRIQYLDDRVAFATISLAIHEAFVPVAKTDDGGFGILEAWKKAAHGFLAVVGWTFVVIATAAPLLVLAVLLWFLARFAARRNIGRQWLRPKSD